MKNRNVVATAAMFALGVFASATIPGIVSADQQNMNNANVSNSNMSMHDNSNMSMHDNSNMSMQGNTNHDMHGMNHNDNMAMGAMLSGADRTFATKAARGNHAEIEMGRLALTKAASDDVKNFAQHMIDDHTKAGEDFMQAASSAGVNPPSDLDPADQKAMDKLSAMTGADFDRAYVDNQIKAHSKMAGLMDKESRGGKNDALKSFASRTLPTVQSHLEMARDLKNKMSGKSM